MVLPFNYYGLECPNILSSINHFDLLGMDPNRQPRYTYDELLGRLPGLDVIPVYSSNSSTALLSNAHVWASSGSNVDNVDVNPATLKGNAATSEQASTAGNGKKGIIKTVPETFPPGVPAGSPTHARGLATPTSQGGSSAFPSATNAIVKIEGEDGNLIQLINGLDENLSKKLDEFRRSNISTRDENLSNLWKQATRARNKAEVAVLVDAAITAAATVRGKQVQRKADAQTRPMIQKLEELRKKEVAKYEIIIGEADQWTKVFQEMKRYLKGL
ncbi:hypothetical protein NU195Hw_g3676t1 [Hortaea werneckii]